MRLLGIIIFILISGCVSTESTRDPSSATAKQLLESRDGVQRQKFFAPSAKNLKPATPRGEASEKIASQNEAVAIYLPGQKTKYVQKAGRTYSIKSAKDKAELDALLMYIEGYKTHVGVAINADVRLDVKSVQTRGIRTFVKFEQFVVRKVNGKEYTIPIAGSSILVTLKNNEVVSLQSGIMNPPSISLVLQNPGFDLSKVSGAEIELMRKQMVEYGKTAAVKKYFENVAANTGQKFDFDNWLKDNQGAQLDRIKEFFANIKKTSTAKMLIDIARMKRLSFVKRNGIWNFQVTKAFNLPIEFELQIPTQANQKLLVKNIRDLRQDVSIRVHESPSYPLEGTIVSQDDEIRTGVPVDSVTEMFQGILGYYREQFNWLGPSGFDSSFKLVAHKGLSVGDYVQNAFWSGFHQHFGIGAGGNRLTNFDRSLGVMGHEYGHAIVEKTSGLVYQGQSGALNEHFADIQGATVEASINQTPYSYLIGHDIVTPEAAKPREVIVDLILKSNKVSEAEIAQFNLKKIALRNLYQPSVSLSAQPASMEQAIAMGFDTSCEPNENNDHCGVHYLSGIPNRATSLIIDQLGFNETKRLFFNTGVNRLAMFSNFSEYVRQLHEECLDSGEFSLPDCDYIVTAFQSVGVVYPNGNNEPEPEPLPDNGDDGGEPTPEPEPESPPLMMCGWISVSVSNNITIIDNKYDTVILNSVNASKFGGNFTDITAGDFQALLPHKSCGCAVGTISQTPNSKNVWFNYFRMVKSGSIKKKPTTACKGIVFK